MTPYIHVTNGRLRIKVPEVKRAPLKAFEVVEALQGLHGVSSAQANPTTGSVLVLFDPDAIGPEKIVEGLKATGCLTDPYTSILKGFSPQASGQRLAERLLESVFETAVQQVILALI